MRNLIAGLCTAMTIAFLSFSGDPDMKIEKAYSLDSLGACQGISYQQGRVFLYGDRETGIIREYKEQADSLVYLGKEMRLTLHDTDVINHPTGLAHHGNDPVFIGNSIRLDKEGTRWRAVIYCVDWKGLQKTGSLDGNLLNTIEDDACIQGTRPEYVQYNNKWYVATADYGGKANEVRLYDPEVLKNATKTSDKGVVFKKFSCSPWVQNLNWIAGKGQLLLIQNKTAGKGWRFSYVDLAKSIASGKQELTGITDIEREDELEGFSFLDSNQRGIAVTSSRSDNINNMRVNR